MILLRSIFILIAMASISHGQESERPNVLMIVVDDMNDWVGCLDGHPDTQTPHI